MHPQAVDLVPFFGGQNLGQLGAGNRLAPHSGGFTHDFDAGVLGEDFLGRLGAQRIDRDAGNAGDHDDVALAVEFVGQPFGGHASSFFLVNADVVGAWLADRAVVGNDHHAFVAGVFDGCIQRGG